MTTRALRWGALPLYAASPLVAHAQDAPPPAPAKDIVVIGQGLAVPPGTPAYGSVVIDRDRLTNDASGRVEDVLADVAGFQQFRRSDSRSANPSAQGATLRALGGNASSRTLVLLDGVPIADPFFGYIPFTALSADRLSAVRVTRGGGSGPFGAGAVAGTIEMVSATRDQLPFLAGGAFYGSDNAQSLIGSYSPSLGDGFVSFSGRFDRGDGFYTTPEDQRVPATVRARYRDWSSGTRWAGRIDGETEIQANGLLFGDDRTLRFKGADSSSQGEDASLRLIHRGGWQVDALAYLQVRNFTNKVISATSFKLTLDQRNTPSTGIGGKVELRPPVGPGHVLRIGGDVRLADGELYEDAYAASGIVATRRNAGGKTGTAGLFVEDDWTLGHLVLTGGARIDRWSIRDGFFRERNTAGVFTTDQRFPNRSGTEPTARVGALFHASSVIDLRAAAYTGFRLPTLNELYRPFVVFPVTTEANANLGLEKLKGVEAGIDLHPAAGIAVALTGFYNRLDGAIANVTIGPNLRERENVDAIVAKGIEITADVRQGAFSLDGSYAFSDSKVHARGQAFDGLIPAQSPRHAASATLSYWRKNLPLLSATLRYVGKQYEDDLQTDVLPVATTLDAVATLPVARGVSLILRGENLFDATVYTRNQAGSIDLGTPRTLWIGLRFGRSRVSG